MINNDLGSPYQDQQQDKLVLPAYHAEPSAPFADDKTAFVRSVYPEYAPYQGNNSKKVSRLLRTSPAHQVLAIAIAVVVIASLIFAVLVGNLFAAPGSGNGVVQNSAKNGAPDAHPTFPTPGGNQGGKNSSLPPQSVPVMQPSVMPGDGNNQGNQQGQQNPPNNNGPLTVQITNIPPQVTNKSAVGVSVVTNKPGVSVRLVIAYSAAPGFGASKTKVTDNNGMATLVWHVGIFMATNATATVTAFATDGNGQQASSQPVTVQITG